MAWMGTARASCRVAVVMSAVQLNPGRTSGTCWSSVTFTRKFVACWVELDAPACWMGLLPISVTWPGNVWSGSASMVTLAGCPMASAGMSVSSTSIWASMTDMSAIVISTVPALFIVPMTTVSPSSMFRRVMMPSMGDSMRTLLRLYFAESRPASS